MTVNVPSARPEGQLIVSDNFQSGRWQQYWGEEIPFEYSAKIVGSPNGPGSCLRLEWRKADSSEIRSTKGVELKTPHFSPTVEQWLGFRAYFDRQQFGPDREPVIIMQYHGSPDFDLGESWRNPVTALNYQNGKLSYSIRSSRPAVTEGHPGEWRYSESRRVPLGKPKWNAWNRFVFHHRFDPTGHEGLLEIWFNGRHYVKKRINIGFNDKQGPYWKFGFYYYQGVSDFGSRVIYFDDMKIGGHGSGFFDVAPPTGNPAPGGTTSGGLVIEEVKREESNAGPRQKTNFDFRN